MQTQTKQLTDLERFVLTNLAEETVLETMETSVDERGLPVFGVIETENERGEIVKAYRMESLFENEDYLKAAEYQAKLASHHKILADYYRDEYELRTGKNEPF